MSDLVENGELALKAGQDEGYKDASICRALFRSVIIPSSPHLRQEKPVILNRLLL